MTRTLTLVIALAAPSLMLAGSAAKFTDYRDYVLAGTATAFVITDVNHDGIPDVVAATGAGAEVLLGRRDGTLAPPVIAGGFVAATTSLTVADFNNDGNPDIVSVIATLEGNMILLALGNGDGTFQASVTLPIDCTNYTCTVTSADFDGDGNVDLAVAAQPVLGVTVYLGEGNGSFMGGQPLYSANAAVALVAGDLNQDGKPDLVVSDYGAHALIVLLGNGDGSFQETSYAYGGTPYALVLADFNNDGKPDVAVTDSNFANISVLLNQGGGVLGKAVSFHSGCTHCNLQSIAAGDFNRDGNIDLASPATILYGKGDGTFQAPVGVNSGPVPISVATGDFNADGKLDLVIGNATTTDISVLLGTASFFEQPPYEPAGGTPRAMLTADFNGDKQADLAIADSSGNEVRVLLGQGNGRFRRSAALPVYEVGAVVAGDFNGDGKLDLAASGENGTSIFLGNGDGTFTTGDQYAGFYGDCTMDFYPAHLCFATADFNGDGIPDLAGALWIQSQVFFLFGNGDGTFRPGPTLTLACTPQGMAVGDFNHDGFMDVVVSCYDGGVQVLPGNGDGTFGNPVVIPFEVGGLAGVAVGDLDGDGNLDIVVAGGAVGSAIYIINGNGDLTFNPPVALAADAMPNGVALADLNGDGRLDIASANVAVNNVAVLINQGNMQFTPAKLYGTNASPVMLVSADVNGDQLPDLIVLDQSSNDLTILLQGKGGIAPGGR